jgi:hypothetical protein
MIIFAITFIVSWALGVLRFEYDWVSLLSKTILFPFGFLFIVSDNYWWATFGSAHFLNDELFGLAMFILSVIGQTIIYYLIYKYIRLFLHRNKNKQKEVIL